MYFHNTDTLIAHNIDTLVISEFNKLNFKSHFLNHILKQLLYVYTLYLILINTIWKYLNEK